MTTTAASAGSARRPAICITTSGAANSSSATGAGATTGSLCVVCPWTGSVLSSVRISSSDDNDNSSIGVSSLSFIPYATTNVALGFGQNHKKGIKSNDTYAFLVTLFLTGGKVAWKCRLPEAQLSGGLLVSPCGSYVIGGGNSGSLYVWKLVVTTTSSSDATTSQLSSLLRVVSSAHYRAVRAMTWSSCGRFLVTGGDDGRVLAFSLRDLVRYNGSGVVHPVRSWNDVFCLPVTSLAQLQGGRILAGGQEGLIVALELCSGRVLWKRSIGQHVTSMTVLDSEPSTSAPAMAVIGSITGRIHLIPLVNNHSATSGLGGAAADSTSIVDQVLWQEITDTAQQSGAELRGHDTAVTSLTIVRGGDNDDDVLLVSGDQVGAVRIWNVLQARACLRVLQPWSAGAGSKSSNGSHHAVTGFHVLKAASTAGGNSSNNGLFAAATTSRKSLHATIAPLSKFVVAATDDDTFYRVAVPWIGSRKHSRPFDDNFWNFTTAINVQAALAKIQKKRRRLAKHGDKKDAKD